MREARAGFGAIVRAFANRNFAIFTAGYAVSLTGLWIQRLAVGWLAWRLTGSGLWLGAIAFADFCPSVLIGPFAGVLADRYDRRRLAIACQVAYFAFALALFVLTVAGRINIWLLFVLVFGFGLASGLLQPARLSLVPSLVRPADMTAAVAINSINFNFARFLGPAVAGVIITAYDVAPAFAINAVACLVMIGTLSVLRVPSNGGAAGCEEGVFRQVAEGFRYVVRHPGIGPLMLLLLVGAVFARPVLELLPAIADVTFGRGAHGLAWLTSATGLGAVLGCLWLARRGRVEGLTEIVFSSTLVFSTAVVVLLAAGYFWMAVVAIAVAGFAMVVGGVGTQVLIQTTVEDRLRGRVLSLFGLVFRAVPAAGALGMGWLSDLFGLRAPLIVGAVLWVGVWALLRHRAPSMRSSLERMGEAGGAGVSD